MEEAIEAKNSILRNLRYSLAHATKAYNDAIRVYEAKLVEFGIPAEELGLELLETNTSNTVSYTHLTLPTICSV